ncbi:MAG: parB-like partition protein [Parcubacteria group bacterium]|nr:parB-like partition protein [Parcubacteria group bacterium]
MVSRTYKRILVASIMEDLVQLRSDYNEESLEELSGSFSEEGQLQPILVAELENENYELIIGSRRLRSAKRNGQEYIDAIVIEESSPLNYILMALAENLHRDDLNAFEEARAFLRLMKDYGLGVEQVAEKTRKGSHYVTARIQLLSLPEEVQALIAKKALGIGFVGVLAKLSTGDEQVQYAAKAASDRLTPPELRVIIERELGEGRPHRASRSQLSAEKVRVKVDMFTTWLGKMPNKAAIKKMNAEERSVISMSLHELEVQVRTIRGQFAGGQRTQVFTRPMPQGNLVENPRNHGGEWPAGDLTKITADDRPSDEELSKQLGRTVGSIRGMRSRLTAGEGKRKTS